MSLPVYKLSIVCPAFQEEAVLPLFHAELCEVLRELGGAYQIEILYIDDGSRDNTLGVLRHLSWADDRVRYLSFSRNFGKEAALTAGLEHARGDAIITLDSDLQHPPALIPTLLARWQEGHDIVLTLREDEPGMSRLKKWSSRAFHKVMGWLGEVDVRSSASDYRLLSRRAAAAVLGLRESQRFLRGLVSWVGFHTTTVRFQVERRRAGASKFTLLPLLRLAADGLLSFSRAPLRASLVVGLVVALTGLLFGAGALVAALCDGGSWSLLTLLGALFLLSGTVLCFLGVVGEYVGRVYEEVKGRPLYLVKEGSPGLSAAGAPTQHPTRSAG
jgi:dolichol-phosphate mannosyltransferase